MDYVSPFDERVRAVEPLAPRPVSVAGQRVVRRKIAAQLIEADLLRRLGRRDDAREAYLAASAATQLEPLRRLYARRLKELESMG